MDKSKGKGKDQQQIGYCRQKGKQGENTVLDSKGQNDKAYIDKNLLKLCAGRHWFATSSPSFKSVRISTS